MCVSILLPLLATWLPAALAKLPTPKITFIKDQYIVSLSSSASLSFDGISESMSIIKEFDSPLFRGIVVSLSDPTDVPKIYALAGAEQVYRPSEYDTVDTFSPHVMTGVNVLHDRGYFGKGMVVGIIDTGVDYTHPALGGCFGPGCKIAEGYDFVGDAYNGITDFTIVPGPNPYSNGTCGPHGTHVSGIVAANSTAPGPIFTGVVPQATLGMYRIWLWDAAGESSTSDPIIIEALIRAYDDGSDVVILSLGGASGWSESASAVVASNLGALGRVVTIAMGNSGDAGTFYGSSPGGGLNVWSIASVDNIGLPSYTAAVSNGPSNFTSFYYFADTPEGFTDLPIYALSNDSSAANTGDPCSPLPASTPDLSGYIVVAKRGTCDFVVKYANVAAAGGKYLFIYNNAPGVIFLVDSSTYNITSVFLYATDGAELVTLSGTAARVSAINTTLSSISCASGGKVSDYSSYGPNFEMDQPSAAVSAPGGNIFSTLPGDSYGIYSGTSMATPFVAGSAALYWSINGKSKSGLALRDIFMSTATPVSNYTGDTILESVTHQGGGLLTVSLAVDSTALVSPGYLLLNDTEHLSPVHMITVTNSGKTAITLPITHEAAGTAITFEEGTNIHNPWPVPLSTTAARVFFSTQKLTLGAGESGSFIATFTPPLLDSTLAPLYSGFIKIGSTLTVPYDGLASHLRDLPVLDNSDWFFGVQLPALVDGDGNFVPKGENVTISKSAGDVVEMVFRLVTGIRLLRVDVVNATSTFHATLDKRQVKGTPRLGAFDLVKRSEMVARGGAAANTTASTASTAFPGLPFCIQSAPTLGLLDYEFYYPRNDDTDATDYYTKTFNGTVYTDTSLDTSTVLSAGSYSILARVLKVTGDPLVDVNYEYEPWRSPTIILTD